MSIGASLLVSGNTPTNFLKPQFTALKSQSPDSLSASGNAQNSSAFKITLSAQAQAKLDQSPGASTSKLGTQEQLLNEIFSGVEEQLAFAGEAGPKGRAKIENAAATFEKEVAAIEKQANGKPLNDAQIERLGKADDAFHQIVDSVHGGKGEQEAGGANAGESGGGPAGIAGQGGGGGNESDGKSNGKYHKDDKNRDGVVSIQERQAANIAKSAKAIAAYSSATSLLSSKPSFLQFGITANTG